MVKKSILLAAIACLGLTSCATMTHEDTGTLGGSVIGGLLGSQFGGGSGHLVGAVAGTIIGGYVGGNIGRQMDREDQRRWREALETTRTGQSTTWRNPDSGNRYSVEPTKTYYEKGRPCRKFRTIAYVQGRKQVVEGRACRDARGIWQMN